MSLLEKERKHKRDDSRSKRYRSTVNVVSATLAPRVEGQTFSREDLLDKQKFHQFAAAIASGNKQAQEVLESLDQAARQDLAKLHGNTPLTRFLL